MSVEAETLTTAASEQHVEARPKRSGTLPISFATIAVLIAGWSLASAYGAVSPVFLPSPLVVARSLVNVAVNGFVDSKLAEHTLASLLRIFAALSVSLLVGVPAGLAIATSRIGKGILDPIVEFLRPLPPLAYLPLIIIWVGIGEASKVTVISLAMLPPIILSTASGVRSAPDDFVNAARSFGAGPLQVLLHVILPGAVPSILTGTRIALGAGWSTLVAAELVAANQGLGFMIQSAAQFLVTDIVIGGIIVIAAIAFLLEILARLIERSLVPWAGHR